MTRQSSRGTCSFCKGTFAKSTMARHLNSCKARPEAEGESGAKGEAGRKVLHLQVEGLYQPMYWLHIEIPENATLEDLDDFLRVFWVECCSHLSSFEINGESYISEVFEPGDRSMKIALKKVIEPGMKFEYIYDFGTSTELLIKVLSVRESRVKGKDVRVLARNEPPDIRCQICGKPATKVCSMCVYEGEGWLCDECAEKHKCSEEDEYCEDMFLPVVNSPRVGMCAYEGSIYD